MLWFQANLEGTAVAEAPRSIPVVTLFEEPVAIGNKPPKEKYKMLTTAVSTVGHGLAGSTVRP